MNTAFPDGEYTFVAGTLNTVGFFAFLPIFTGASINPVTITNFADLQDWPTGLSVTPTWSAIPGAVPGDYVDLLAFDSAKDAIADISQSSTTLTTSSTTATFGTLPVNSKLEGALQYAKESYYTANGGQTLIEVGVGFNLGFGIFISAPPVILSQPTGSSLVAGSSFGLSVSASASSAADLSYQWYKNGVAISGATSSSYHYSGAKVTDSGSYTVTVTSVGGAVTSAAAIVAVAPFDPGRIINLSISTISGTLDQTLAAGFVVAGSSAAAQPILVRGIGPTLGTFGISGTLVDPVLQLIPAGTTTPLATNDDWGGDLALATISVTLGAFPLPSSSTDAVLYQPNLAPGNYSAVVAGKNGGTGVALAEIYDATPAGTYSQSSSRLINVSGRAQVSGSNILTGGFTIGGTSNLTVVIRASGPALSAFGLSGISSPLLGLYKSGSSFPVATNGAWGGTSALSAAFLSVGAFGWADSKSNDCALLITLAPGSYSAQVSAGNGSSGVALLEIYEVK